MASYTRTNAGGVRSKQYRPTTRGDARQLITEVFARQREGGWDERDVAVYLEGKKVSARKVEDLTPDEMKIVIDALEKAAMLIFAD